MVQSLLCVALLGELAFAGTLLWDGRIYNRNTTIQNLRPWDISNDKTHHGPYQYYIHGNKDLLKYVDFSPSFKNPGDTYASDGIKITIDGSSSWHGQQMMRTELVQEKNPNSAGKCFMSPNLKAETNRGTLFYHFSMKKTGTNSPKFDAEHQINFLHCSESHVVDLRYGVGSRKNGQKSDTLYWVQNSGNQLWETSWKPNTWLNFAYEMDFGKKQIGLWFSNGSEPLQNVKKASVNGGMDVSEYHLGVLRLGANLAGQEDYYMSGVYIESAPITKEISGPKPLC